MRPILSLKEGNRHAVAAAGSAVLGVCGAFLRGCCGRVYWISTDTAYAASAGGQSVSETALPRERGNFYDCKCRPLTGTLRRWYALCIPGDSSYATLFPYVPFADQNELYARRNSMTPF